MNIFENFQNFFKKPINEVIEESSGVAVPMMKWFSYEQKNLKEMQRVNEHIFWSRPQIAIADIFYNINRGKRFVPYLKKAKDEPRIEMIIQCLARKYGCGKGEIIKNWKVLVPQINDEMLLQMAREQGVDKKDYKVLGIKYEKVKVVVPKPKPKGLMGF